MTNAPTYDVALSFAQENREFASRLAHELEAGGFKVYYDKFGSENLLGRDLNRHLRQLYSSSRLVIILVSSAYLSNSWTKFELETAVARARDTTYNILLIKLDECQPPGSLESIERLPGISESIEILDLGKSSLEEVKAAVWDRVSAEPEEAPSTYYNPEQQRVHIISREKAWSVKREGSKKALRVFDSKRDALNLAHKLLSDRQATEVIVHKTDGSVEKRYGLNS